MKENHDISYDPLVGVTIDLDPGTYIIMDKEDWLKVKEYTKEMKKEKPKLTLFELEIPDPGPPVCDECGINMWTHSSSCSKIGGGD